MAKAVAKRTDTGEDAEEVESEFGFSLSSID